VNLPLRGNTMATLDRFNSFAAARRKASAVVATREATCNAQASCGGKDVLNHQPSHPPVARDNSRGDRQRQAVRRAAIASASPHCNEKRRRRNGSKPTRKREGCVSVRPCRRAGTARSAARQRGEVPSENGGNRLKQPVSARDRPEIISQTLRLISQRGGIRTRRRDEPTVRVRGGPGVSDLARDPLSTRSNNWPLDRGPQMRRG
jgi:hypothetical protein